MTTLEVTTRERSGGGFQVELAGELDLATAPKLEDELRRVEERAPGLIVIDLQGLEFMDSSGLRALLAADARAREGGRRLVLVRGDERVQRVLRITRLDERLEIVADAETAARAAAQLLVRAARQGRHIALSGGSTPRRAYEAAAALEPDWGVAHVWWGDERCVPPEDERSNFRLARESLLDRLARRPAVHRIRGELGPDAAADEYERELRGVALDLVLLGLGADGHTASLFPHAPALGVSERLVLPVTHVPLPRVTLSPRALSAARQVTFLVTGREKADAAARAFAARPDAATPASLVRSRAGATLAILDRAAAAALRRS